MFEGLATTLGEVKKTLSKEGGCVMCENISSAPLGKTEKGPQVKASLRDHFSVEASNPINDIKHPEVKNMFDFKCKIKS